MRDLYNLYAKRTIAELNQMRSKKFLALIKAEQGAGFFASKECTSLKEQIAAIDAELEKRKLQQALF